MGRGGGSEGKDQQRLNGGSALIQPCAIEKFQLGWLLGERGVPVLGLRACLAVCLSQGVKVMSAYACCFCLEDRRLAWYFCLKGQFSFRCKIFQRERRNGQSRGRPWNVLVLFFVVVDSFCFSCVLIAWHENMGNTLQSLSIKPKGIFFHIYYKVFFGSKTQRTSENYPSSPLARHISIYSSCIIAWCLCCECASTYVPLEASHMHDIIS